jgi:hypothetical protein
MQNNEVSIIVHVSLVVWKMMTAATTSDLRPCQEISCDTAMVPRRLPKGPTVGYAVWHAVATRSGLDSGWIDAHTHINEHDFSLNGTRTLKQQDSRHMRSLASFPEALDQCQGLRVLHSARRPWLSQLIVVKEVVAICSDQFELRSSILPVSHIPIAARSGRSKSPGSGERFILPAAQKSDRHTLFLSLFSSGRNKSGL